MLSFKKFRKIVNNKRLYNIFIYLCSTKDILMEFDEESNVEINKRKIIKNKKIYNVIVIKGYKKTIDEVIKTVNNIINKVDNFTKIKIRIDEKSIKKEIEGKKEEIRRGIFNII